MASAATPSSPSKMNPSEILDNPPAPTAPPSETRTTRSSTRNAPMLEALLDTRVRVELPDGRILTGVLWCIDGLQNIILRETTEHCVLDPDYFPEEVTKRRTGAVMIPGKEIVKFEVSPDAAKLAAAAGGRGLETSCGSLGEGGGRGVVGWKGLVGGMLAE